MDEMDLMDLMDDMEMSCSVIRGLDRNLATRARRASEGIAQSRCASLACASG
jgi:hypothetical protein